jgi:outer membrane protein
VFILANISKYPSPLNLKHSLFILVLSSSIQSYSQEGWDLSRCISTAWERNIDIQKGELNLEVSEITLRQNRYSLLPSLNGGATHGYNWGQTIDPFTNQFATDRVRNNNLFLSSNVTLYRGFTLQNNIKKSKTDLAASKEDLRRTQNDISLFVAQAFLSILLNEEQLKATEEQVAISQRQADRMKRLVDAGQAARNNLFDLESQLASDQLNLTNTQNNLVISMLGLSTVLLLTPEEYAEFKLQGPDVIHMDLDKEVPEPLEIYSSASGQLPQIRAATLRVESSDVNLDIARGGRSPYITMSGSLGSGYSGNNIIGLGIPMIDIQTIGYVESSLDEVVSPRVSYEDYQTKEFSEQLDDNFNQSMSLSLTIPIFNRMQVSSDISRAKLNYQLSKLDEQSAKNQLLQDVQQAHADVLAARRSFSASERSVAAVRLNFDNAEKRFEQEMINPVEFNDAKSRLAIAETQLIRARYDLLFKLTIIDFYMGKTIDL